MDLRTLRTVRDLLEDKIRQTYPSNNEGPDLLKGQFVAYTDASGVIEELIADELARLNSRIDIEIDFDGIDLHVEGHLIDGHLENEVITSEDDIAPLLESSARGDQILTAICDMAVREWEEQENARGGF